MKQTPRPTADNAFREPAGEPRLVKLISDGEVIRRIPQAEADEYAARGWAVWRGIGCRRHLALTIAPAAISSKFDYCTNRTTDRVRDDAGQIIAARPHREHRDRVCAQYAATKSHRD